MRVKIIRHGLWKLAAVCNGKAVTQLEEDIAKYLKDSKYKSNCAEMLAKIEEVLKNTRGPLDLGIKHCKLLESDPDVFEFIKGDLRMMFVLCTKRKIILATDLHIKHGSKVNKKAVSRARELGKKMPKIEI